MLPLSSRVLLACAALGAAVPATVGDQYTITNLGIPPGADITTGVRMNNLGHVAGYSIYYGQGEPSIRPWVWTPEDGFTVLPPPPDMFLGRARAMDISDTGIVAGDGGYDAGIAWRYENGVYETFGTVGGMPIAYLGAVNDAGDVAGTARDGQLTTEDEAFLDLNGFGTINLTPGPEGGRCTDINNAGQICGYSQGGAFGAFRWSEEDGFLFLGALDLAYSFASDMNDLGQVVGYAVSASGNTSRPWIWSDGAGQQAIGAVSSGGPAAINDAGWVVGTRTCCGPNQAWIWTPEAGMVMFTSLVDFTAAGLTAPTAHDINDAGQVLLRVFDNNAVDYRMVVLTPVGDGDPCPGCPPTGACCLTDGSCVPFLSLETCLATAGTYLGDGESCAMADCTGGVPNDDCADALAITDGDTLFSTLGATTDGPSGADACGGPLTFGQDIWYLYDPAASGTLTVSTCNQADFDTKLAAYAGSCDDLQFVTCNDDASPACLGLTSLMEVPVNCLEPLLIRVGGFSTQSGIGTLTLTFEAAPESGACAACPCDVNGDQVVDVNDLVLVITAWDTGDPDADINDDGLVDVNDLVEVIVNWGPCP